MPTLDLFRGDVMMQFRALAAFIRHSEAQLQDSYHTRRSEAVTEVGAGPAEGEAPEDWAARRDNEIGSVDIRYRTAFARIMRFSLVVMCYTTLESSLVRVASEILKRRRATEWKEQKGEGVLSRFSRLLQTISAPLLRESAWELADQVRALRNCIAHRNGRLADVEDSEQAQRNDKIVRNLIDHDRGARLIEPDDPFLDPQGAGLVNPDDVGSVMIEERFCREVVREFIALMNDIFERAGCFHREA